MRNRYSNAARDPHWMVARFDSKDSNNQPVKKGQRVFYYPASKTLLSGEAAEQAARDFEAARADEAFYNV